MKQLHEYALPQISRSCLEYSRFACLAERLQYSRYLPELRYSADSLFSRCKHLKVHDLILFGNMYDTCKPLHHVRQFQNMPCIIVLAFGFKMPGCIACVNVNSSRAIPQDCTVHKA